MHILSVIDTSRKNIITNFYEPIVARMHFQETSSGIFHGGIEGALERVRFYPYWMHEVFGSGLKESFMFSQAKRENELLSNNRLMYSNDALKLALRINHDSLCTETALLDGWYNFKWQTHPAFFLNFLRYTLKNHIFKDLEEAVSYLEASSPLNLLLNDALVPSDKLVLNPEDLPHSVPVALIQGRFFGIPHADHEAAIQSLVNLKHWYPLLKVVIAMDAYDINFQTGNDMFRASLFSQMPGIDYILLVKLPSLLYNIVDSPYFDSPINFSPIHAREAFYDNYLARVFEGRKNRFLYVNRHYPSDLRSRILRQCQNMNIIPIERDGEEVWSSSVLSGIKPKNVRSPFNNNNNLGKNDPEEVLLTYWEFLANDILRIYLTDKTKQDEYRSYLMFGSKVEINYNVK